MSFDPNWPQQNTVADAGKMREQFNGLKAIAEAIPGITGVEVDSVVTLEGDHPARSIAPGAGQPVPGAAWLKSLPLSRLI